MSHTSSQRVHREVILTPGHSQWWLLSPGVSLYYDTVKILESDLRKVFEEADQSSYHEELALRLEALQKEGEAPVLMVVPDYKGLQNDYASKASAILRDLLDIARDPNNGLLDPQDLITLARDSFQDWIAYNERKEKFLHPGESLQKLLAEVLLPQWRSRLTVFDKLLEQPDEDVLVRFEESKEAQSTLLRLLASASRCIDLVAAGHHIYDPMLVGYMPAIALLERVRTSDEFFTDPPWRHTGDVSILFEAYRIRMARYQEAAPLDISRSTMRRIIAEFADVRQKLGRVDSVLTSIDEKDPATAFEFARKEIHPLVREAEAAEKLAEYGYWVAGLFSPILGVLGLPSIVNTAKTAAGAMALVRRNVGRFAGSYSTIADSIVTQQRYKKRSSSIKFDRSYFDRHYRDFARK